MLVGSVAAVAGVATQALTYSLEGHKLLWFALGVGMAVFVRRLAPSAGADEDVVEGSTAGSAEEVIQQHG